MSLPLFRTSFVLLASLSATMMVAGLSVAEDSAVSPMQIFEDRIMPIFRSDEPSSCVQCHLASVDLKNYILPSHIDTFVALREDGLVDLDQPRRSKILTLIKRGEEDADGMSRRIHEKLRNAEYEAFATWIEACCQDQELRSRKSVAIETNEIGPTEPIEVVRHARKSRILDSFERNVWSQRMRCFPCHTPDELDAGNPKHAKAIENHHKFVQKYGAKMNLFAGSPIQTMNQMLANSRRVKGDAYPLINMSDPASSLLLLKPTAKLPPKTDDGLPGKPSSSDPVSHMGGLKMHPHDPSYKAIVAWIADYADITSGKYVNTDDLPSDNWVPTDRILRVKEVPERFAVGTIIQLMVHAKTGDDSPIAFTQGTVTPRRFVNGALFLLRGDDGEMPSLEPAEFEVRMYVDGEDRLRDHPRELLGDSALVGQADLSAKWLSGFKNAEVLSADAFAPLR